MAVYFAVFNRVATASGQMQGETWESAKLLGAQTTAPHSNGGLEDAQVVRLEASTVAEAQKAVQHFFGGEVTDTPVIVAEAQFKES